MWDLRPLGRPGWWLSLAVLLVNDNLLKGKGLVPGWLTGKLSDFAFLIVAPVLLFVLLPRAVPGRRWLAITAVGAVYLAADLSPAFSDWLTGVARAAGLGWRLWPDPTDLLALVVLPASWRLMRAGPAGARPAATHRVLAMAGALACLATSAPEQLPQTAFLVNRGPDAVPVSVSWALEDQPCTGTIDQLSFALKPEAFSPPVSFTLGSADVAALDAAPPAGQSPVGTCHVLPTPPFPDRSGEPVCTVVLIQVAQDPPVIVRAARSWFASNDAFFSCSGETGERVSRCAPRLDPIIDPGEGALALEKGRRLEAFTGIELAPYPHAR
jgi:hypothetical protein